MKTTTVTGKENRQTTEKESIINNGKKVEKIDNRMNKFNQSNINRTQNMQSISNRSNQIKINMQNQQKTGDYSKVDIIKHNIGLMCLIDLEIVGFLFVQNVNLLLSFVDYMLMCLLLHLVIQTDENQELLY